MDPSWIESRQSRRIVDEGADRNHGSSAPVVPTDGANCREAISATSMLRDLCLEEEGALVDRRLSSQRRKDKGLPSFRFHSGGGTLRAASIAL